MHYLITNHLIRMSFRFEYEGVVMKRLEYDPFMYEYLQEYNIDFIEDVIDILLKKGFHERLGITELELKEKVSKLPFDKGIVFDFENKEIRKI